MLHPTLVLELLVVADIRIPRKECWHGQAEPSFSQMDLTTREKKHSSPFATEFGAHSPRAVQLPTSPAARQRHTVELWEDLGCH